MTATVIGELTADERTIVLLSDGPTEDQATAARYLQTLTPLFEHVCACGHLSTGHVEQAGQRGPCKACGCPGYRGAALQLPATWAAVVQLSATFGAYWKPGPRLADWTFRQLVARTSDTSALSVAPPAGLEPRPYQVAGARMIGLTGSALLFDEMGTGKTVTAIAGVRERVAAVGPAAVLPVVVVCPSSVVDSWVEHFQTWAPELRVVPWKGAPARRRRRIGTADVYVASYGTAAKDAATADQQKIGRGKAPLMSLCARTVISDEVHKIKDAGSTYSRAVRNLAGRAHALLGGFVGLSGTPITHSPKDLWPALYCVAPHAWPSSERWATRYCDTIPGDYGSPTVLGLNQRAEPEFRETILGQYRRVAKADVLAHLPPKVYSVRHVELPERYRKAYDALESEMLAEMPDGGDELEVPTVLAQLTRLLQLASAAADVTTWYETLPDPMTGLPIEKKRQDVKLRAPSWKVDELLDIMAERPGAQVLASAPSRQLMEIAAQAAQAKGYRVGRYFGLGDGVTAKGREREKAAFQAGELDLICVTTDAGGVGLTLTAASVVAMLQRPWSFVQSQQIEDRAHRIGSERHECVEIIDIVAAKTVETRVRTILRERAGQLSELVQDPRIVAELLGGTEVRDLRKKAAA